MTCYVVMNPPAGSKPDLLPEFVRDRFSVWAFVLPPVWLASHRLWIEAALALGAMLLIPALAGELGFGAAASLLTTLVSAYVALEGPQLRLAALARAGWTPAGVYEADDLHDAEDRYAAEAGWGPWASGNGARTA